MDYFARVHFRSQDGCIALSQPPDDAGPIRPDIAAGQKVVCAAHDDENNECLELRMKPGDEVRIGRDPRSFGAQRLVFLNEKADEVSRDALRVWIDQNTFQVFVTNVSRRSDLEIQSLAGQPTPVRLPRAPATGTQDVNWAPATASIFGAHSELRIVHAEAMHLLWVMLSPQLRREACDSLIPWRREAVETSFRARETRQAGLPYRPEAVEALKVEVERTREMVGEIRVQEAKARRASRDRDAAALNKEAVAVEEKLKALEEDYAERLDVRDIAVRVLICLDRALLQQLRDDPVAQRRVAEAGLDPDLWNRLFNALDRTTARLPGYAHLLLSIAAGRKPASGRGDALFNRLTLKLTGGNAQRTGGRGGIGADQSRWMAMLQPEFDISTEELFRYAQLEAAAD